MSRLTYSARKSLPKSDFALPGKREGGKGGYPIPDKAHARNALARVSQFGTQAQKAEVRAKVHAKYPSIGESKVSKSHHSKHLHHESERSLHERGHHESHKREHDRAELTHNEWQALDHGGKHDHMIGRDKED